MTALRWCARCQLRSSHPCAEETMRQDRQTGRAALRAAERRIAALEEQLEEAADAAGWDG